MYGFRLTKSEYIGDIASEVFLYEHTSGARLVFAKNSDKNRVVMPVFLTPPKNDKGIAHIVEHSVLCGSRAYPLKDPFNVLERGSIYTYLNAVTYEDKTVYPVASTDPEELMKMARVYADAVFRPLMTENEGIFMQEGVYRDEEGINGVVLNEMKGAFANESKQLCHALRQVLYKGCPYEFYSGGVPGSIEKLTYDEFKDFYMRHYGGSGCVLYVYGDVDIKDYMALYAPYLEEAGKKALTGCNVTVNNSSVFADAAAGSAARGMSGAMFACCNAEEYEECIYLSVLSEILLSGKDAVLRRVLVDSGLASGIGGSYDDSSRATRFFIYAEGMDCNAFKKTLENTFKELAEGNIPEEKIISAVESLKFYISERDFGYKPTGLFFGIELMKGLLYGDNSFEPLKLKAMLEKAYTADYGTLIKKYFIGRGVYGFTAARERDEAEADMPVYSEPLKNFRNMSDSREALALIPLKDPHGISPEPVWFDCGFEDGCLYTEGKSDIVYLDLVYPLEGRDIGAASFYGFAAPFMLPCFAREADRYFGRFTVRADCLNKEDKGIPMLIISCAFLRKNTAKCLELIDRFVKNSDFADTEKLLQLAEEKRTKFLRSFAADGHVYAVKRARAALCIGDVPEEMANGIAMFDRLGKSDILSAAEQTAGYISSSLPIAVLHGSIEDRKNILSSIGLGKKLPSAGCIADRCPNGGNFGINSSVNCNALALKLPYYDGAMEAASQILRRGYLWDRIRLEGGAYSGGCGITRNGTMYIYSYRDPRYEKTYEVFRNAGRYLAETDMGDNELRRYVTGSLCSLFKPVKENAVNSRVLTQVLLERDHDTERELIGQQLECDMDDVRRIGGLIDENMDAAAYASVGGAALKGNIIKLL